MNLDAATRALTDKRRELLKRIDDGDVRSVRGLAGDLDRDKAAVSRDLDTLFEYGLVEYDRDGARKIPKTKHETVLVKLLREQPSSLMTVETVSKNVEKRPPSDSD